MRSFFAVVVLLTVCRANGNSCEVNEETGLLTAPSGSEAGGCCKLTQSVPKKPFPSLTQCYKYNTNEGACCKSGHDSNIQSEYENLLSSTCLREFTHLEFYFCLGCNAKQYVYTDEADSSRKVLRICNKFAEMLFDPAQTQEESDRFERCGLNMPIVNTNTGALKGVWTKGNFGVDPSGSRQVVMPFDVFENASQFLNTLKPPYFEDYFIEVVPDDDECFSAAPRLLAASSLALVVVALTGLLGR